MKFPYDGSFISPEMGALGIPSFDLTEADKKRALWQALMQGGIGMAAASLGGANTSQALGKGLLGGADAYGQALSAPLQRMELFGKQLKLQGDQLSNAKNLGELNDRKNMQGLLGSVAKVTASPFEVQGSQELGVGPLNPNLPEMQAANQQAQAAKFRDPAFLSQLMASGIKGSDLTALAGRFDPRSISANSWQQDPISGQSSYFGSLPQGMSVQNGRPAFMPGYQDEVQKADAAKAFNEQAIKAKFDDWVKQQEAGREVVTLPNKGTPETVLRSQLPQILGGGPAIGKNDPQPAAIYSNAAAAKLYASMPDGPEKQSLGRALMGGQQGNSGMGQGVNPVVQKASESINSDWVEKTYRPIMDAGSSAQSTIDAIRGLRGINLSTGMGTELKGNLAAMGAVFGIKDADKYASNVQRFQSLAMDSVNKTLMEAKGMQTEGDALRAQQTYARLANTPAANEYILDLKEAGERKKQRAAAFFEEALPIARQTGDLTEISRRWRKIAGSIWDDPIMKKWENVK
jgi:hypothetical protein